MTQAATEAETIPAPPLTERACWDDYRATGKLPALRANVPRVAPGLVRVPVVDVEGPDEHVRAHGYGYSDEDALAVADAIAEKLNATEEPSYSLVDRYEVRELDAVSCDPVCTECGEVDFRLVLTPDWFAGADVVGERALCVSCHEELWGRDHG